MVRAMDSKQVEDALAFKVGEVVTLQSGGPKMTVWGWTKETPEGCTYCVWHDSVGHLQSSFFVNECLKRAAY